MCMDPLNVIVSRGDESMPGRAGTHWMTGEAEQGNFWRSQCRHGHGLPEALLLVVVD